MYICCKHCLYTGNFVHEIGHYCTKHAEFINLNNKESIELMFNCKDCRLTIDKLLSIARYMTTISFEYEFDEYFQSMNNMRVYYTQDHKMKVEDVTNTHVIGYKVLFNNYPVYHTKNKEEIELIKKGLGLK